MVQELAFPTLARNKTFSRAFSLTELLVVISIIVMLTVFAAPAITNIAVGSNLERAGQTLGDTISLARQEAVARNREVRVAFLEMADETGTKAWRGIEVWRMDDSAIGVVTNRVAKLKTLPPNMIIATNGLSPLLENAPLSGTWTTPSGSNFDYRAFRFRANGATDTSIGTNNYVTVKGAHAKGDPPDNYFTVQINPVTGKVTSIRP